MKNLTDLSMVEISAHALKRFQERWYNAQKPENWEKTLRKLLRATAEIRKIPLAHIVALIKYKESAKYFLNSGWVFVTNKEATMLLTVMRYLDYPTLWEKSGKLKKRKRRK